MSSVEEAEKKKEEGNAALKENDLDTALTCYSAAIDAHPTAVYYSNRAAVFTKQGCYEEAVDDADQCIALKPEWPKGYSRKATALHLQGDAMQAMTALQAGMKAIGKEDKDGQNALKKVLNDILDATCKDENYKPPSRAKMAKKELNKERLMVCLMGSMVLGHITQYVVGWGWPIAYMALYALLLAMTGIMLKPVEPEPEQQAGPKPKKGLWRRLRPYALPALYWHERKED